MQLSEFELVNFNKKLTPQKKFQQNITTDTRSCFEPTYISDGSENYREQAHHYNSENHNYDHVDRW